MKCLILGRGYADVDGERAKVWVISRSKSQLTEKCNSYVVNPDALWKKIQEIDQLLTELIQRGI